MFFENVIFTTYKLHTNCALAPVRKHNLKKKLEKISALAPTQHFCDDPGLL